VAAARALDERRRALRAPATPARHRRRATVTRPPRQLRARHAELSAGQPDITGDVDHRRAALTRQSRRHTAANREGGTLQKVAAAATRKCKRRSRRRGVLREKLQTAQRRTGGRHPAAGRPLDTAADVN
jgi:hypothetical protein